MDKPDSELTLREYCAKYAASIFVRAQVDGKWGGYSLKELPAEAYEHYMVNWEKHQFKPARAVEN